MSNKETNLREKLKQALSSTIKVISDDLEKNTIAEYYQRCFGDELPESLINIQI